MAKFTENEKKKTTTIVVDQNEAALIFTKDGVHTILPKELVELLNNPTDPGIFSALYEKNPYLYLAATCLYTLNEQREELALKSKFEVDNK
tara:strand:- start:179 stop:451 length:273 start_codon:yes stop_codon:yes gene_type:complete